MFPNLWPASNWWVNYCKIGNTKSSWWTSFQQKQWVRKTGIQHTETTQFYCDSYGYWTKFWTSFDYRNTLHDFSWLLTYFNVLIFQNFHANFLELNVSFSFENVLARGKKSYIRNILKYKGSISKWNPNAFFLDNLQNISTFRLSQIWDTCFQHFDIFRIRILISGQEVGTWILGANDAHKPTVGWSAHSFHY